MNIATGVRNHVSTVKLPAGARVGTPVCETVCVDDLCGLCPVGENSVCVGAYTFPRVLRLAVLTDPLNATYGEDFFALGGPVEARRSTATRAFWGQSFVMRWQPLRPWESAGKWVCHDQMDVIYDTQDSYTFPGEFLEAILTLSKQSSAAVDPFECFTLVVQYQINGTYHLGTYTNCSASPQPMYLDTASSDLSPLALRFRGDLTGWNGLLCDFNPDGGWYITL